MLSVDTLGRDKMYSELGVFLAQQIQWLLFNDDPIQSGTVSERTRHNLAG
jgi:hypothetical protein